MTSSKCRPRKSADRFGVTVSPYQIHPRAFATDPKQQRLLACRRLLQPDANLLPSPEQITAVASQMPALFFLCPVCGIGQMIRIQILPCIRHPAAPVDSS